MDLRFDLDSFQCFDPHLIGSYHSHLARFQKDNLPSVLKDGRGVAREVILAFPQADHHAAGIPDACGYDLVRFIG